MDESTLDKIAGFICGNDEANPEYRSSSKLTAFFQRAGLSQFVHDGSTRQRWVLERLRECNREQMAVVLKRLASPREYAGDREKTKSALVQLNDILYVEGFKIKLVGTEPKFEKITIDFSDVGEEDDELKPLPAPDFLALGLEYGVGEVLKSGVSGVARRSHSSMLRLRSRAWPVPSQPATAMKGTSPFWSIVSSWLQGCAPPGSRSQKAVTSKLLDTTSCDGTTLSSHASTAWPPGRKYNGYVTKP